MRKESMTTIAERILTELGLSRESESREGEDKEDEGRQEKLNKVDSSFVQYDRSRCTPSSVL